MPFTKKGRHARHEIKSARPRWLTLLVALGLFAALMPMSAAFAEGQHSPAECDALETTEEPNADVATAPEGFIIDAICIKSGTDAFDEFASDEGPKHSILITANGTYDGYVVTGIGTSEVTVDDSGVAHDVSHIDYRLVEDDQLELEVEKAWAGDEIDLAGVTVDFTIAVNGTVTEGAGPVDVEEGDSVVITEEASGLPDNCSYESDLANPYIVDADDAVDGLITRIVTNTVDCVNVPQGLLTVEKTAEATFDRDHDWSILKSVDPAVVNLSTDGLGDATVTWDIDVTYEGFSDSGHEVTGTITITNDEPLFDARIDTVSDSLGEVVCIPEPSAILAAGGGTMECDYSLTGVTEDGTNTVTVTGELIDTEDATNTYTIDETDSADFSFVLDEETDETVVVSDLSDLGDLLGDAGYELDELTLHADESTVDEPINFTYSMDFDYEDYGQEDCGDHTYGNTATITGDEENDESSASVDVNVQCLIFDGETATGEGLPWKATKRAPNNWFMYTTWTDIADGGADIIAGQFYDVGDVTGSRTLTTTTLTFELDGDWELADVVGNVKINPMTCTTNQNYKQPGQFANSFTVDPDDSGSFSVTVPNNECYGIHLSVGQWIPDPNFPPDAA